MKKRLNSIISIYDKPVLGSVKSKTRFMALAVDKSTINNKIKYGVAREITKSKGSVDAPGFIDESKLIIVKSKDLLNWKKVCDLKIKGIDEVIKNLEKKDRYFIGLEDPDIYNEKGIKHLYFTIAYKIKNKLGYAIFLGHAKGKRLDDLIATKPVLVPKVNKNNVLKGFREVAINPIVTSKGRINLAESGNGIRNTTLISCLGKSFDPPWKFLKTVLNPKKLKYNWVMGDLSPCCFLPTQIKGLLVGIINGREKSKRIRGKTVYGKFRPGLILFNPKTGEIPWISPEPLFEDPDARTITFASDFIKRGKDKGLLYCHVNDSFVRCYEVDLKKLKERVELNVNLRE